MMYKVVHQLKRKGNSYPYLGNPFLPLFQIIHLSNLTSLISNVRLLDFLYFYLDKILIFSGIIYHNIQYISAN